MEGDHLCDLEGARSVRVISSDREELAEPTHVYTFRVETDHTYFVSDAATVGRIAVWVHNVCSGPEAMAETLQDLNDWENEGGAIADEEEVTTLEVLEGEAQQATNTMGPGRGPVYGTRVHTAFEKEVNGLGRSDLSTEVSYKGGLEVDRGTPGSVRLDVVEKDANGNIIAVYDLKTGSASLSASRISQIRTAIGKPNVPVFTVRP